MKLAFSTLGCPNWSWDEIFATAKDLKMEGIEIRGMENEMYAPAIRIFSETRYQQTLHRLKEADIGLCILTSGAMLGLPEAPRRDYYDMLGYIDLAHRLGVPNIRVMVSLPPEPVAVDLNQTKDLYIELCEYAEKKGTHVLMESNGIFADSSALRQFMQDVNCKAGGVLWDIHHPFRIFGEDPEYTYHNLGEYIRHVHLKDSVMKNGRIEYRMMGYGDVPVLDALRELKKGGYQGFLSLEWMKRWNADLQEPGIVFAHYKNYMDFLLAQLD